MTLSHRRVLFVFAILAAWAIIVVARLVQVQIVRHEHYSNRALRQQERTLTLSAVRGSILDARGRVLAESVSAESIYADPQVVSRKAAARAIAAIPELGLTAKDISARLNSDSAFVWIARQVPLEVAAKVKKLRLPGIYTLEEHRRSYPRARLAANVIGYAGVDGEGLAGIEHSFDDYVRGKPGKVTLLRDARRGMYLVGGEGANRPVDGHDVILTIDAVVQFIAERALARAVSKWDAAAGSAIVMEPSSGRILAMASWPTFDPNRFRDYSPAAWRNRNVQDIYEPGSVFKIIGAAAGLEERLVTPSQIIDCGDGAIRIANIVINEHDGNRFGLMTFEDTLVHSSNVGLVRLGLSLGSTRMFDYSRRFGFGERTGVRLPGEAVGLLRRTEKWTPVSVASISIGQEIGATPLQVARAVATVANGGMRVQPRIVDRVVDAEGRTIFEPEPVGPERVISERTAAVLNEMLKSVVRRGTGAPAALADHVIAGKTGTSQKAIRGGYSPDKYVSSFAGYVPADRPRLVILVVIDEPKREHYGGLVAAPVFREIAEGALRYLRVPPSLPARSVGVERVRLAAFSQQAPARETGPAVPDLRGLDAREAVARATAAGLTVRAVGSGVVQSQNPEPGNGVPNDRRLDLTLREVVR